jgi:hypothetical protein
MPRTTIDIERFNAGQLSSPDLRDVPEDAAVLSLDVDGNVTEGELVGRLEDEPTGIAGDPRGAVTGAWMQRDGSIYDLLYHDGLNNDVRLAADAYETAGAGEILFSLTAGDRPSFVTHARDARVGYGSDAAHPPKWVGYIDHANVLKEVPVGIQVADAELYSTSTIPFFHKTVAYTSGDNYALGIAWDGDRVYKINLTTGALTTTSSGEYTDIRSICLDSDGSTFWIFCNNSTYGTLYHLNRSDLTLATNGAKALAAYTLPDVNCYIADIADTDNHVWLAAGMPATQDLTGTENWLFNFAKSAASGTAPTNRTPQLISEAKTAGNWVTLGRYENLSNPIDKPWHWSAASTKVFKTYPVCLHRISGSKMGWNVQMQPVTYGNKVSLGGGTTVQYSGPFWLNTNPAEDPSGSMPNVSRSGPLLFVVPDNNTAGTACAAAKMTSETNPTGAQKHEGLVIRDNAGDAWVYYCQDKTVTKRAFTALSTQPAGIYSPATTSTVPSTYTDRICSYNSTTSLYYAARLSGVASVDTMNNSFEWGVAYEGGNVSLSRDPNGSFHTFDAGKKYFWGVSLTYDGIQESPLTVGAITADLGVDTAYDLTVTLRDATAVPARVSHVNIYRASGEPGTTNASEYYRLIRSIRIDEPTWSQVSGTKYEYVFTDEAEDAIGQSYEARSGISETLERSMVNYNLCELLNGSLFVAKCYHPDLPDGSHMLFKSKPFRLDSFNWTEDYLRLPFIPTAIKAFAGRLYVFGNADILRVNPEGMFIEDTFPGYGIADPLSVIVTEKGMFFANTNSVYFTDGKTVAPISTPVNTHTSAWPECVSWQSMGHTLFAPRLAYLQRHDTLLAMADGGSNKVYAFALNIGKKRWDVWTLTTSSGTAVGLFQGVYGEVFYSCSSSFDRLAWGPTRKAFKWISKVFTADAPSQYKKWYFVRDVSTGTAPEIKLSMDGGALFYLMNRDPLDEGGRKFKDLSVKIVGSGGATNSGATRVRSLSLAFRRMEGIR